MRRTALSTATPISELKERRIRPFLKWAGGKTQIVESILETFPRQYGRYHEPFVGGGAVFFALKPERASLSDVNAQLIDTYSALRDNLDGVVRSLKRMQVSREEFYRIRAQNPRHLSTARAAARLIYLNKTCFNGLYRVNQRGEFNVPFGRYPNLTLCQTERLRAASEALTNVTLRCQDMQAVGRQARRGDLVYFDPPYVPLSATANFITYARGGFDAAAHVRLAKLFTRLAARGVHVVLSNADTPWVRHLYRDFHIRQIRARRAINCRASSRGAVNEVLVSSRFG